MDIGKNKMAKKEKITNNILKYFTSAGGIIALISFFVLYAKFGSDYVLRTIVSSIFYVSFTLAIVLPVYNRIKNKRWF